MPDTEVDDLRGDLAKAFSGEVEPATPPVADMGETPPVETAEAPKERTAAERARDEQGRFAKEEQARETKARETLTIKPKDAAVARDATPPITSQAAPAPDAAKPADIPPPMEWKGAAKVDWNRLPAPVKAEIAEKYAALATERAEVAPIKELIDTNRQFLVNEAGSIGEAFRQMVQFARLSVDNPVALAQHILRARGIDPASAFGGQPQQGIPGQPPQIEDLVAQTVQQTLQPLLAQFEQRESQQHIQSIEAFASDPAHPYFNDVRPQMAMYLKSGQAKDLKDAYEQATWAHPVIRQQLLAAQAEDAAKAKAAEVQRAQAASRASLTGPPVTGNTTVNGESDGSIRGDLMRAFQSVGGAV